MRVNLLGLVAVFSSIATLASAAPRETNGVVWSDRHTQVVMEPTPALPDQWFYHTVVVRRDGREVWSAEGVFSVEILWRSDGAGGKPKLVFSTLDFGNGATGDVVAVMAGSNPAIFEQPIELAENIKMRTQHGTPAFDQALGFGVEAFAHNQYLYDRVPTVWTAAGFKIDYPALARRRFSKADLNHRLASMRAELATAKFADEDGYRRTPHDSADAVLPLVLSGKAKLAHDLFNQAWPAGRDGRDQVWQDICDAILVGSDWPELDTSRIKDSELIEAGASKPGAHSS